MKSFSRRRMLAAVAAAGGVSRLAPFLPHAVHAAGAAPQRILTVFSPMGYVEESFWPTGSGTSFTLGETQSVLAPYKSKMLYLDGLALYGAQYFFGNDDNEHAAGGNMVFTGASKKGFANGPSVEQHIANFQYLQAPTPYKVLPLGVDYGDVSEHTGVFYSKAQTPITPQGSANATYDRLFKNFTPPTPVGGATNPGGADSERVKKQQQSVLNFVKGDLTRIRAAAGREDQIKVDDHMDGISSLENRLKSISGGAPKTPGAQGPTAPPGTVGPGCAKPVLPALGNTINRVHAQMDLIASAFACDLTRSASLQLGHCDGGIEAFGDLGLHDAAHAVGETQGSAKSLSDHKRWDRWWADRWAYLFSRLDGIKEGNGTLLDNTLIVFGSDTTTAYTQQAQPQNIGPHSHMRFPMWMAGGGNFAFKTGQVIKLPAPTTGPNSGEDIRKRWVVHHRLLTSVCQAFGVPDQKFGDLDPGTGPLTQLQRA